MIRELARSLVPMGQRNRIARARVWLRRPTAALRTLPDFLVLGAMRAGTSSLYRYLGAHPSVSPSLRKEVEYFTRWYHRGEGWYRAHFPLAPFRRGGRRAFEATPYYLCHPHAPERAQALLPEARFLVVLRDPVARAISHHRHLRRLGIEIYSFEEAIDREPERLAGEWERILVDPRYESRSHHLYSYLERGLYARQLERWFAAFPPERFLVLEHDELFHDLDTGFREVLSFLDLDPWSPPEFRNFSRAHGAARPAHEPAVPEAVRERLALYFEPHNRELEALLGRSFAWNR